MTEYIHVSLKGRAVPGYSRKYKCKKDSHSRLLRKSCFLYTEGLFRAGQRLLVKNRDRPLTITQQTFMKLG